MKEIIVKKNTCPRCGREIRRNNLDVKIKVLTKFGRLHLIRNTFFCRYCHAGFAPLDREIGLLPEHKTTMEMADLITYAGQMAPSFEKSSELIERFTGIKVSESLVRTITEETGQKLYEQDMARAEEAFQKPEIAAPEVLEKDKKHGVLYLLTDGSTINTTLNEEGSSWREMKLGLVFWDKNSVKKKDGKSIITKKEYVAYFGEVEQFKKLLLDAAARAGYGRIREVVVIGDGAHWIWNMCDELFPDAVQILDYYHLSANAHEFAKYLYPDNEIMAKVWVKEVLKKIDDGRVDEILKGLPDLQGVKLPVGTPNLKVYLENNRERINYRRYKLRGYYIGSGPIESGHKMVIQQRMKQSGMRWSIPGGQYVATLRTKYASNQWDEVRKAVGL